MGVFFCGEFRREYMRIVSQDKRHSINFDNIVIAVGDIDGKQVIYCSTTPRAYRDDILILGEYASLERAQDIFNDIHKAYSLVSIVTSNLGEEAACQFIGSRHTMQKIIQMDNTDSGITVFDNYVYYMPES